MGYVIGLAGKGGTGKTTIAALLVRIIKEKKIGSVLAIDADPNSNLQEVLGVELKETIGQILDDISAHPEKVPKGITKDRFIEYRVQTAIAEGDGFDLLSMGRPEGPGCYCYVNNALRAIMAKLINDYQYIIIDNEAGLEHLSRRTTEKLDTLLVISDATSPGLRAAKKISELAVELKIQVKKKFLMINRANQQIESARLKDLDLAYLGFLPQDALIGEASLKGSSLISLDVSSEALTALVKLGEKIWS